MSNEAYRPNVRPAAATGPSEAYIDLLRRSVLGLTVGPTPLYQPVEYANRRLARLLLTVARDRLPFVPARRVEIDLTTNTEGRLSVWHLPPWTLTMIGAARLENIEWCVRDIVSRGIPGDLIETGVWRGGTTIFMRGILQALAITDRCVYVADSFTGVPPPDPEKYPADRDAVLHMWPGLAVGLEEVQGNFERYGLLDEQVVFVKGWFRDTLPKLSDHKWALIRLDGDLYESTMDSLANLYPGLSPGGWLIVDDFGEIPACKKAVLDYRLRHEISEPIQEVDFSGICWQKRSI